MRIIAREGMRVHVFSTNQSRDLGFGTIEKVETVEIEETGEVLSKNYPSIIRLDTGEVMEGMTCWWYPLELTEKEKVPHKIKPRVEVRII